MATIVERKSASGQTRYLVMVRLRGYPAQGATFDRKTDAKRWAAQTETGIREGRHFKAVEAKRHTLGELVDRYLREGFQHKPASFPKQRAQLEWWRRELGAYPLSEVTPARIVECRAKLAAGARTSSTVNRYLAVLSDCFTDAVKEYHWLEQNPVLQVKKFAEPKGRTRFLSREERDALIGACRNSGVADLLPVVLIALTTGARHGEIVNLTWKDVDLARGLLIFRDTKNKETRSAPLVGEALTLLATRARVRRIDTDLVFAAPKGARPVALRAAFENALKLAAIRDFRFHDLRHTAASYLAMSGATLAEIAAVLGHKTLMMVKRYSHLTDQHTAGIVARMHEKFFERS